MILRKYLAWLTSTATLLILSSLFLPNGFVQIANWIGPLLGLGFRPELQLFFLFIGPSLSYLPLLLTWVSAGVIGGFFARGVLRSMAAGTLSVVTLVLLIVGNGVLMFSGLRNLNFGTSGFNFPPPPPGFNLADILNAPIIAQLIQGVSSGGGLNPLGILSRLTVNFAINLTLYAASFIASGIVFSKIFRTRREKPAPPQPPTEAAKPPPTPVPTQAPTSLPVAASLLVMLILVSSIIVPVGHSQGPSLPAVFSGEQLVLSLDRDSNLRMLYFTNTSTLPGVPLDYQRDEFQGLVAGFLFAFNGSIDTGPEIGPLSFLLPLLPQTGFLAAYRVSDPTLGKTRSDLLASEFGQGFELTLRSVANLDFQSFGGQQIPGGGIHLTLYTGDRPPRDVGVKVLSQVQAYGVGTILTSDKVFVNQYGVLAGFVNLDFENATARPSAMMGVIADLTPLGSFFGRGSFTLGLREVFGSQGTIGPSSSAGSTRIQLLYPANFNVTAYGPSTAPPPNSTAGQLQFSMNSTDTPVSNVFVTFSGVFPQHIQIERRLDPEPPLLSGTTVTEKITVRNLGNETIRSVQVSEKKLFQTYPTLQLLSPSYTITLGDIPAQGFAETTLQFKVMSDGVYTLSPAEISYIDQGETIHKASSQAYMQSSFNMLQYLQALITGTVPYSYPLLVLVLLPLVFEVVKLARRPRSPRKAVQSTAPSPTTPSQ